MHGYGLIFKIKIKARLCKHVGHFFAWFYCLVFNDNSGWSKDEANCTCASRGRVGVLIYFALANTPGGCMG